MLGSLRRWHLKVSLLEGLSCLALSNDRSLHILQLLIQLRVLTSNEWRLALTESQRILSTLKDPFRDEGSRGGILTHRS